MVQRNPLPSASEIVSGVWWLCGCAFNSGADLRHSETSQNSPHRNFGTRAECVVRFDFGLFFLSVHFLSGGAERKWTPATSESTGTSVRFLVGGQYPSKWQNSGTLSLRRLAASFKDLGDGQASVALSEPHLQWCRLREPKDCQGGNSATCIGEHQFL